VEKTLGVFSTARFEFSSFRFALAKDRGESFLLPYLGGDGLTLVLSPFPPPKLWAFVPVTRLCCGGQILHFWFLQFGKIRVLLF
jgi:hypothetical protein